MYPVYSQSGISPSLIEQVASLLQQQPGLHPAGMAEQLNISEGEVVLALPSEMVTAIKGEAAEAILQTLSEWGPVTTIVHNQGSIFEVKARFPKGKTAHGYYNLMGRDGELHGHLKLTEVAYIALVSKPFNGKESHFIGFFSASGQGIFKVYLGRDNKRQLIPEQVEKFQHLKQLQVAAV
ncbi:heme utilization cystosolic carrier protein HutX [Motilimonas eburnea]|uniref:heme utilization cystosolic carrier protein HutX n=1 Tax=Motilimonas eburnea TaxID=1737488 RepID=UPI001E2A4093|nr:heme utilization cystosolic carrier protein HutX [Motilimonas eburnea]